MLELKTDGVATAVFQDYWGLTAIQTVELTVGQSIMKYTGVQLQNYLHFYNK